MVQCEIHVQAADVPLLALRDQKFRNPAANKHYVITILAEDVHQLDKHRSGRFYGGGGVIYAFSGHNG